MDAIDEHTRAVAVLHALPRFVNDSSRIGLASQRHFQWTMDILQRLPREVREHPSLYLFSGGEAYLMGAYDFQTTFPRHATVFVSEPLWAQTTARQGYGLEPLVPQQNDACYLYQPKSRFATVPFWQPSEQSKADMETALNRADRDRHHRVFHYAGLHGQATGLRQRLYDLCSSQGTWSCPRDQTVAAVGTQHGELPLTQAEYVDKFGWSTFSFVPAGDSPGRISMWDCLRRGCVPVFFSTCPMTHALQSHRGWLPPDDSLTFGVRAWSVLLNQTAVMTDSSYLHRALDAVSDEQLRAMRASVRPYLRRMSYELADADDDALALTVEHMLQQQKGGPRRFARQPSSADYRTVCPWCEASLNTHTETDAE